MFLKYKMGLGLILVAGIWATSACDVSATEMDYFEYGSLPGTVQGEEMKYVKVNLYAAWDKISVPSLSAACQVLGEPNPQMSVVPNPHPAIPGDCNVTNYGSWRDAGQPFTDYRFLTNANFFQLGFGYNAACGNGLGVTLKDGSWISGANVVDRDVHGVTTHTLILFNLQGILRFHKYAEIVNPHYDFAANRQYIRGAISGYSFMHNNRFVVQPPAISPGLARPRTAVGISRDGNQLIFLSINVGRSTHGEDLTAQGSFYTALEALGAHDVLNLDGGGSAQLVLSEIGGGAPVLNTLPSDVRDVPAHTACAQRFYRPVPVVIGVE